MRIAFAGTPEFAARSLAALIDSRHEVGLVLSRPDSRSGRGMDRKPSPVKALALERGLPVFQPATLRTLEDQSRLADCALDVLVVAAYGIILPQAVLDLPRLGAINVHASLLPRWRGAAPIHRALLAGDARTGVAIMQMEAGLDTGPVLLAGETPISDQDTAGSLHDRLASLGAKLIVEALDKLETGALTAVPQDAAQATYAAKLTKDEARIDWAMNAETVHRRIRAFNPFPGSFTRVQGADIKIWKAQVENLHATTGAFGQVLEASGEGIVVACGKGALRVLELQRAGGRALPAGPFLQGMPLAPGQRLGE